MPFTIGVVREPGLYAIGGQVPNFPEFCGLGYRRMTGTYPVPRHNHPGVFEICVFVRGEVSLYTRDRVYQLRGGDVFVAKPGEFHGATHNVLKPNTHYFFSFKLPRRGPSSPPMLGLPLPESRALCRALYATKTHLSSGAAELEPYLKIIMGSLESGTEFGVIRARAALQNFLVALVALKPAATEHTLIPPGVMRARDYLETCPVPWPKINDLAEISGMSASHFCASFSRCIGTAPLKFGHHMRLRRATELLGQSGASVTAVALQLGYASSQHLATRFRQYLGRTPRAVLKLARRAAKFASKRAATSRP